MAHLRVRAGRGSSYALLPARCGRVLPALLAFLLLAGASMQGVSAQATADYGLPQGFSFWNEISSDLVESLGRNWNNHGREYMDRQNYNSEFAGIKEKVALSYGSEKLYLLLAPEFTLGDNGQHWSVYDANWDSAYHALNRDDSSFAWTGLDWRLRFSPFDLVEVNLRNDVTTSGGHLPVLDRWFAESNLQGGGFGLLVRPVEALRIGLELPMGFDLAGVPNLLNGEVEDGWWPEDYDPLARQGYGSSGGDGIGGCGTFVLDAGADLRLLDLASLGVTVHDMLNPLRRSYGLYAGADLAFLAVGAGYTYNGDAVRVSFLDFDGMGLERVYVGGRHKANAAVTVRLGGLKASVDALYNFKRKQSIYDLYAGARAEYAVIPGKLDLALAAALALDFGNESENGVGFTKDREKGLDDLRMYTKGIYWFFAKRGSGARNSDRRRAEVAAPMLEFQPCMTYVTGRNTFSVKASLQYWIDGEGSWAASFPLSWKYSF